jgi:hypothetical protein
MIRAPLWLMFCFSLAALGAESFEHAWIAQEPVPPAAGQAPLVVLPLYHATEPIAGLDEELITAVTVDKLSRLGIPFRLAPSAVVRTLPSKNAWEHLAARDRLAPKLILVIAVRRSQGAGFDFDSHFELLSYQSETPTRLVAEPIQALDAGAKGLTPTELRSTVVMQLRRGLERLPLPRHRKTPSYAGSLDLDLTEYAPKAKASTASGAETPANVSIGFTGGTPAVVNALIEWSRPGRLPFELNVSGMYYGAKNRGAETHAHWFLGNTGAFTHKLGLGLAWLNDSHDETVPVAGGYDVISIDKLKPFLGPSYGVQWNHWRGELGVGQRLGAGTSGATRIFFHVGYVIPLF